MILLVHLLFGALIGKEINNQVLAVILAFLGHYLLDLIPHTEYSVENIKNKQWKKSLPDFIKVFLDILCGLPLIFIFSPNNPIIYVCAFFAILPDGLSLLKHSDFHSKKIHFLKDNKKFSKFWRISSQVAVVLFCLGFLAF